MSIYVDTSGVRNVVLGLGQDNEAIRRAFPTMENAVLGAMGSWSIPSVEKLLGQFQQIKTMYYESRTANMQEFVKFLQSFVGEGYELTETENCKISDLFR